MMKATTKIWAKQNEFAPWLQTPGTAKILQDRLIGSTSCSSSSPVMVFPSASDNHFAIWDSVSREAVGVCCPGWPHPRWSGFPLYILRIHVSVIYHDFQPIHCKNAKSWGIGYMNQENIQGKIILTRVALIKTAIDVGVDKIIRIVLPSEGPVSPYIHEKLSWYKTEWEISRSFETPPGHTRLEMVTETEQSTSFHSYSMFFHVLP